MGGDHEQNVRNTIEPGTRRVLLVDDHALCLMVGSALLRKLGCDVGEASGGREAIDMLTDGTFEIVLMDIEMPELDGLAATRMVREGRVKGCRTDLPIVAVTGHADKHDRQRFLGAGMNDVLTKPMDLAALRRVFAKLLADRA